MIDMKNKTALLFIFIVCLFVGTLFIKTRHETKPASSDIPFERYYARIWDTESYIEDMLDEIGMNSKVTCSRISYNQGYVINNIVVMVEQDYPEDIFLTATDMISKVVDYKGSLDFYIVGPFKDRKGK